MTSKYPITVDRLPTFVLFGHSNADGWTGTKDILSPNPHLTSGVSDPIASPDGAWYKNVYVFTSEQPWVPATGTPIATDVGDGEWLELAIGFGDSPNGPWVHPSPFAYPNTAGACYPHWLYKAYDSILLNGNNGVRYGVELPLQWHWKNYWQSQVGIVKLAFGSSFFLPVEAASAASYFLNPFSLTPADASWLEGTVDTVNSKQDFIGWWTPTENFDFSAATNRLYGKLIDKLTGAQAALPNNAKMDIQLLIPWMGDNDAAAHTVDAMANLKQTIVDFIRKLRDKCVEEDWTTLPAEQIIVCWVGVLDGYGPNGTADHWNNTLDEIAADDPYFFRIDSNDFETAIESGETSAIDTSSHFGSVGYLTAADAIMETWIDAQTDPFDAIDPEDRLTVSEVKDRVRTYYNRARVSTDIEDAALLIHLNAAIHSILNRIGDNAYWLRRREDMTFNFGANSTTTLPRRVSRLLKIEDAIDPRYPLKFTQVGFAEAGKVVIQLEEFGRSDSGGGSGTYTAHYITRPKDVTRDEQLMPFPRTIIEWVVLETCRRLARSSSNIPLQSSMEGEARELGERCLKELQVMQRAKKDRLYTARRFPTLRYRR